MSFIYLGQELGDANIPEGIGARFVPVRLVDFGGKLMLLDSYGTAKSGVGISAMSVLRPDLMMRCVIPVIMAGIIAVRIFVQGWCSNVFLPAPYRSTASSSP